MKRKITLFAVAGSIGLRAASGFFTSDALSRNPAAREPNPRPDRTRKSRREASIDIEVLVCVEPEKAQGG